MSKPIDMWPLRRAQLVREVEDGERAGDIDKVITALRALTTVERARLNQWRPMTEAERLAAGVSR